MGLLDKLIKGTYKNQKAEKLFPENRKEVFAEMFRHRKLKLINVSLLCALCALPTLAVIYLGILYKGLLPQLIESGAVALPDADSYDKSVLLLNNQINNLVCVICIATNILLFMGLAGGMRVIQKLVWGENTELFADFGAGIKQNFLMYSGFSLLFSVSQLFAFFVVGYYILARTYAAVKAIAIAIAVVQFVIVCGILCFALPQANIYKISFVSCIKNGFILFIAALPKNFGLLLLTLIPIGLVFIPNLILQTVFSVLILVLYPASAMLVWLLYTNSFFDKYMNVGEAAAISGKGIVWEKDEEN